MYLNSSRTYGLVAQLLHWATAALIFILVGLGIYMHELPAGSAEDVAYKVWFYSLHKTLGVTALFTAILRVVWAIIQPHPRPLNGDKPLESLAARTIHWILYGAIIAMPVSGWLHHSALEGFAPIWWALPQDLPLVPKSPALAAIFGAVHFFSAILLGVALTLHIAGALKHVLIDRDDTLARMTPFRAVNIKADLPGSRHHGAAILLAVLAFAAVGGAVAVQSALTNRDGGSAETGGNTSGETLSGWQVDPADSRLGVQIIQSGKPVSGQFAKWNAAIDFDPENLTTARVVVEVDVASLTLGAVSENALSADFLNAEQHPVAVFEANEFVQTAPGSFEARGTLQLAGISRPLVLPFDLKIENDRAFVDGSVTLNRLDFDVGKKGFSSDEMVGFGVDITVMLQADRTK